MFRTRAAQPAGAADIVHGALPPQVVALGLAVQVLLGSAPAAPGRVCPAIEGGSPALAAQDVEARLAFIEARLRHDGRRARQWSWAFGGSYAAIAVGSVIAAPQIKDVASRPDLYVGAGSALIGLGLIVVAPLQVMRDSDALAAHVAGAGPDVDRCRLLAVAEARLVRDARSEAFGRGWLIQSGNALLGVAAALILGFGYRRWVSGVINGVASIAVGELMILTQPIGLVRDLRSYRAGDLRPPRTRRRARWSLAPSLTPRVFGLQLVGQF